MADTLVKNETLKSVPVDNDEIYINDVDGGNLDKKTNLGLVRKLDDIGTLAYSATTDIDFDLKEVVTLDITGNLTLTTSNRAAGKRKTIKILCDATPRTFSSWPAWIFVGGAAPTGIAANKTAILTLECFSTTDASIVAAYAVQP